MENLQIVARFRIHDGKLADFKRLAEECLTIIKNKDKETLQFDSFFNQEQTECVVIERYTDSNALLNHLGNINEVFGQLLSIADFKAEVFGVPSQDLLDATTGIKKEVYNFYQGLEVSAAVS